MVLGSIGSAISGGLGLYSGLKQSKSAGDAYKAQIRALEQQLGLTQGALERGQAGGDALEGLLNNWLQSAGTTGQFNPDTLNALSQQFLADQAASSGQAQGLASQQAAAILANALGGMQQSFGNFAQIGDPPDVSRQVGNVQSEKVDTGVRRNYFDDELGAIAQRYLNNFNENTSRAANQAFGQSEVDSIRRGMERSSYDIESRKAVADMVAQRGNEDQINAINAAIGELGQKLGMEGELQRQFMTHQQGTLMQPEFLLRQLGLESETGLNSYGAMLQGLGLGHGINVDNIGAASGMARTGAMNASDMMNTGSNLFNSMLNAQQIMSNNQGLRAGTMSELNNQIGYPLTMRQGATNSAQNNYANMSHSWGNTGNSQAENAARSFSAFGDMWDYFNRSAGG
jgi:hypothetical protein